MEIKTERERERKEERKVRGEEIEYNGDRWANVKGCREEMRGEAGKSCRDLLIGTTAAVLYS